MYHMSTLACHFVSHCSQVASKAAACEGWGVSGPPARDLAGAALLILITACSGGRGDDGARHECAAPSFRACAHECGRGVSECVAPGAWGPCECTVVDSGFHEPDASASIDSGSITDGPGDGRGPDSADGAAADSDDQPESSVRDAAGG